MSEDDEVDRRRALALAALAASADERPRGARPTREEIRRWIDGEVAAGRAAEIDLHVALDPELHARWRELRLARLGERADGPSGPVRAPDADGARGAPPPRAARDRLRRAASCLRRRLARFPGGRPR